MPALITMVSSVAGPTCKVAGISQKEIEDGSNYYAQPLNCYFMCISDTGGGKTPTFQYFIKEPIKEIFDKHGVNCAIMKYSSAGLYTHINANEGYALCCMDEGNDVLSMILKKQKEGDSERSTLNSLWSGQGGTVSLKDGVREVTSSSFSMLLLVHPKNMCQYLIDSGCDTGDGYIERNHFLCVPTQQFGPKHCRTTSKTRKKEFPIQDLLVQMGVKTFEIHRGIETVYILDDEALELYDELGEDHVASINKRFTLAKG